MSEPFTHGSGFRITGVVESKWVKREGDMARVTIKSVIDGRKCYFDLKTFSDVVANEVAQLKEGMTVETTGAVGSEKLTNKDKTVVQRDGRDAWVPMLRLRTIKVDPASQGTSERQEEPPPDLSDVPF